MPRRVTSTSGNSGIGAYCLFAYDLPFWQALQVIVKYTFSGRRGSSYFRLKSTSRIKPRGQPTG